MKAQNSAERPLSRSKNVFRMGEEFITVSFPIAPNCTVHVDYKFSITRLFRSYDGAYDLELRASH